jgi:hypothetical protein
MQKLPLSIRKALLPAAYPIRNLLRPRAFHAYAVGLPRTGTHSMAYLFAENYRSLHEPTRVDMINLIYAREIEGLPESEQAKILRKRDRLLWLEMESSNHISYFAPLLASIYPDARFIVLLRDPYSWFNSIMTVEDENVRRGNKMDEPRRKNLTVKFGAGKFPYTKFDEPLRTRQLAPLAGYMKYYQKIYTLLTTNIPQDRSLIVYTKQISSDLERIAQFLGIPADTLDRERAHSDARSNYRPSYIREIDRDYLEEQVQLYCSELLARYFPTIRSMEDAFQSE